MEASTRSRPKAVPDPESDAEAIAAANGAGEREPDLEGAEAEEQARPELEIEASGQLSIKVGGEKPDTAQVRLQGGSIQLREGQFEKGEYVNLVVKARCAEVHFVDKIDKATGDVVEVIRRHKLKIEHVEKV